MKDGAAVGSGASCGCGSTTAGRCSAGTLLAVLLVLAAVGVGIWSLLGPS